MPLYNCFSNNLCPKLNISDCFERDWAYSEYLAETEQGSSLYGKVPFVFNTEDSNYKIYMVPVKLFATYTIAIDCFDTIELCCGFYGKSQDFRDTFKDLPKRTYMRLAGSVFAKPFLYSKLANLPNQIEKDTLLEMALQEKDLKLFIKIPAKNISTITILEGNYLNWNAEKFYKKTTFEKSFNLLGYGEGAP
jgi:hypothetical protein